MKGYTIAYCTNAYAIESGSADMREEEKRKVRIAAGGLQSIWRLRPLLNPFRYGILSFQYTSHRVLRWSITPFLWFALFPLNIAILLSANLGVMNLLPIPALDGGRLILLIVEAIRRRRVEPELEAKIHFAGLMLLMLLMVVVMFNDVKKLIL